VVTHVVDGDTFYLKLEAGVVKARLAGVNAPECRKERTRLKDGRRSSVCSADREFFGLHAYQVLRDLVYGKRVAVRCEVGAEGLCGRGNYGRYLLDLTVDDLDVATELVGRGAAFAFTKYFHQNLAGLCKAEDRARQKRTGMWNKGTRGEVLSRMSRKTRSWYLQRDDRCRAASGARLR
jgi:endonuclease YncB( thermonuclease family)